MVDYRIRKGQEVSYQLQSATKNAVLGVSPLSNRKMFIQYHQPSFIYGTDTMCLNTTDLDKLETKYRKVLKCLLSLPDCTPSAAVYLSIGVLPATAQRDVEILGLLGQLAMCDQDTQSVRAVLEHTFTFYGVNFPGWTGLVRRTCLQYGLPDPLQYLQKPWRSDRWRAHCKKTVHEYWDKKLIETVESSTTLKYVDTSYVTTLHPMRVWQMAGLCSDSVKHAAVVNWMSLGIYFTQELLFKIKKAKSPLCLGCDENEIENLNHLILHCQNYKDIRENFIPKHLMSNKSLSDIFENEDLLITSILDPLSANLPYDITKNWTSAKTAYETSRQFCYNLHRKREKWYKNLDKLS